MVKIFVFLAPLCFREHLIQILILMAHPSWAMELRQKGQEIKKIQGKYYLYEVSSHYDKVKKRTVKKSGKYLGRITPEGLMTPENKASFSTPRKISIKEYGASHYIVRCLEKEIVLLQQYFPKYWREIIVCCVFRLLYQSAFKQMHWHYQSSYLSEEFASLGLEGRQISNWLKEVGEDRGSLVSVMKGLQEGEDLILVDSTHITTYSKNNLSAQLGYNSQRQFDPQINLLYFFSQDKQMPIFYRCVQGSVREVRSLQLSLEESGLGQAVLVSDKGFYSENNIGVLEQQGWQYILPLRRSSRLADYEAVQTGDKKDFEGFFLFEKRVIWYKTRYLNEFKRVVLFLDESLKVNETADYLRRTSEGVEGYSLDMFHKKQAGFGTISVLTNTVKQTQPGQIQNPITAQEVYQYLKSRNDIEQLNDTYKNVLEADRTYMQSEAGMEAWHFINFLAIRVYYRLFALLKEKELTKKYSPMDVLLLLQCQKKAKINEHWMDAEIPKKAQLIIDILFERELGISLG